MNHSTRAPTKYEAERIEAMKRLGCVACAVLGIPYAQIEVHHLLDGGVRMGHWFTIPLCAGHHRGLFTALQRDLLEEKQQVAISDGRKLFRAVYGTERELWERVQTRLKLPKVWPVSKILPRGRHVEVDTGVVAAPVAQANHAREALGVPENATGQAGPSQAVTADIGGAAS